MGRKKHIIEIDTPEQKAEVLKVFESLNSKNQVHIYYGISDNKQGSDYIKYVAHEIGFDLNTYKIKTKSRYLLHPRTVKELQEFVSVAKKENWPFWVLGNGSNVILADTMYNGVIIKLDQFKKIEYNDNQVVVGAGVMINYLSKDIINHGLSGLEWASGIPGTVGGSKVENK